MQLPQHGDLRLIAGQFVGGLQDHGLVLQQRMIHDPFKGFHAEMALADTFVTVFMAVMAFQAAAAEDEQIENSKTARLLYMGHASLRIVTAEEKVIYIDPYAGNGYELAADLILVTHAHYDHNDVEKVENRNPDCRIITWEEALEDGKHQTFDLGFVTVEAVEAGNNKNHDIKECVGYVLTLSDGVTVYISGDTSRTEQMAQLDDKELDYAFFCCDGVFNMGLEEAAECAELVGAQHTIPYHIVPPDEGLFDKEKAEQFQVDNRLILAPGEETALIKSGLEP